MQPDDRYRLRAIERLIKRKFDVQVIDEAQKKALLMKRLARIEGKPKTNARPLKEEAYVE